MNCLRRSTSVGKIRHYSTVLVHIVPTYCCMSCPLEPDCRINVHIQQSGSVVVLAVTALWWRYNNTASILDNYKRYDSVEFKQYFRSFFADYALIY